MDVNLFRNIARRVNPVVVAIMTRSRVDVSPSDGDDVPTVLRPISVWVGEPRTTWLGSGFVINEEGDILTNNHVVAGADVIEVELFGDENKNTAGATSRWVRASGNSCMHAEPRQWPDTEYRAA